MSLSWWIETIVAVHEWDRATVLHLRCCNSFQRMWVHRLAETLGYAHGRWGEWTIDPRGPRNHFDWECRCRFCWQEAGKRGYRIVGVWMCDCPLEERLTLLTRKDRLHQIGTRV